jgi:hypothetical protein
MVSVWASCLVELSQSVQAAADKAGAASVPYGDETARAIVQESADRALRAWLRANTTEEKDGRFSQSVWLPDCSVPVVLIHRSPAVAVTWKQPGAPGVAAVCVIGAGWL